MPRSVAGEKVFSIGEVAAQVGVSKATLHRWLRDGRVSEPRRDRNGWRIFSVRDVEEIRSCADRTSTGMT
ncbi:MerR family transcriptional regulator [Roseovarius sp. SCSIO 43702]|uniref:MerR family transcriptional regulator n=1 Tax=Roseovarius sp. SCSIO 43702 TaxID=2823043 RepID=UPI001C72B4ED|nr:MerR family transcriptional regulator [Roseovarius sp. SCSIO 43702]